MITISMEKLNTTLSWSLSYFIELFSTILLTSTIVYQTIYKKEYFLLDLFSTILSIFIIISQNLIMITNYHILNSLIMLFKIFRLFILIGHLRILRLIILTFIQRYLFEIRLKFNYFVVL
jgi:hypothetical protein